MKQGWLVIVVVWVGFGIGAPSVSAQSVSAQDNTPEAHATPYGGRADVADYLDALAAEHDFDRVELATLFAGVHQRQDVIERISKPAEKVWTWARYKALLVSQARVDKGVEFWAQNVDTLQRAEDKYGVAPEYVLAILGIETRYGQITGSFPVIDALTTLGFDYPPRAKFFRKELTQFLLLAREEGKSPGELMGSYAGAMGYGQFIPSSYRHYAVDFDADGVRDIWSNPEDAIGSIANYFAMHKWRGDEVVALPVTVAAEQVDAAVNGGLELTYTVAELRGLGVQLTDKQMANLGSTSKAALYKLDGADGDEYWMAMHDFYVITRYNHSHMYALAVHELSQAIKAKRQQLLVQR